MASSGKKSVLFICLGNICRSPMAEAVFLDTLKKNGQLDAWEVDSAAMIDYHVGKGPEPRTLSVLKKHGVTDYKHTVRQISTADFSKFDYIFGMDEDNMSDLHSLAKHASNVKSKVEMLGDYDPQGERIIIDPYYNKGEKMFEICFEQCVRSCAAFLEKNK